MLPVEDFRRRNDSSKKDASWINSVCRKCEQAGVEQYRTMTKEGFVAEIVRRKKNTSRALGVLFDLTPEWVREQLDAQDWKCALTGLPLCTLKVAGEKRSGYRWDSISVDRVRPKGGYTKNNVRFILNVVNLFKSDGDDDRMYMIAEALIARRQGGQSPR